MSHWLSASSCQKRIKRRPRCHKEMDIGKPGNCGRLISDFYLQCCLEERIPSLAASSSVANDYSFSYRGIYGWLVSAKSLCDRVKGCCAIKFEIRKLISAQESRKVRQVIRKFPGTSVSAVKRPAIALVPLKLLAFLPRDATCAP